MKKNTIYIILITSILFIAMFGILIYKQQYAIFYNDPAKECAWSKVIWQLRSTTPEYHQEQMNALQNLLIEKQNGPERYSCHIEGGNPYNDNLAKQGQAQILCCNPIFPCPSVQAGFSRDSLESQKEVETGRGSCTPFYKIPEKDAYGELTLTGSYRGECHGYGCISGGNTYFNFNDGTKDIGFYSISSDNNYDTNFKFNVRYFQNGTLTFYNLDNTTYTTYDLSTLNKSNYLNFNYYGKCHLDGNTNSGNCNVNAQITDFKLENCDIKKYQCGPATFSGTEVDCGKCSGKQICVNNKCEKPCEDTCQSLGIECGQANICGKPVNCGDDVVMKKCNDKNNTIIKEKTCVEDSYIKTDEKCPPSVFDAYPIIYAVGGVLGLLLLSGIMILLYKKYNKR